MKLTVITILFCGVGNIYSLRLPEFLMKEFFPSAQLDSKPKSETNIHNKNVNVMLAVDPKMVAHELMKLIEERSPPTARRSMHSRQRADEIEKLIAPIFAMNAHQQPSAFELAYALDQIARRAILPYAGKRSSMDDEIAIRNLVSDMMQALKGLAKNKSQTSGKLQNSKGISHNSDEVKMSSIETSEETSNEDADDNDDDDDEHVTLKVQVLKSTFRKVITEVTGNRY